MTSHADAFPTGRPQTPEDPATLAARPGLADLDHVPLSPARRDALAAASRSSGGSAAWKRRKIQEARRLHALAEIAPRFEILEIELGVELRVLFHLWMPVPCSRDGGRTVSIAREAMLGLVYPETALRLPLPGYAFLEMLVPVDPFHPQIGGPGGQRRLCLGPSIATGTPASELILMAHAAVTFQALQLDPTDAAGMFNVPAALYWSSRAGELPLSRVPFLGAEDLPAAGESAGPHEGRPEPAGAGEERAPAAGSEEAAS